MFFLLVSFAFITKNHRLIKNKYKNFAARKNYLFKEYILRSQRGSFPLHYHFPHVLTDD